ncbi:enoyl-CoA hydratase [Flavobacterium akiainvivens]|uniref:Enoyl-CoA hydratase n=1 Tax=Flavobacterium akiainvivens TaxID=1202724 RepID=A0A0N0RQT9_9FLAO|nr:enoyl-CoA hydratase/isomerase family protein [Flavobacterium akiainvivens]KOS06756.1 enoyl-CoA hydratase [Flavobacterium akiainvivens]SFQ74293.1 methylglutaconyl-CoA hydratase [Flavobacterium akiainvivens]
MSTTGTINTTVSANIATITFGHPAGNSFPSAQLKALTEAFTLLGNNPDVSIIILQSEGEKAFCAGASFDELLKINTFEAGTEFFSGFANVINAMRTCPKLIVGRIQGKAVGGGVGLAAACDYCFATDAAAIKLSEFTIGIGPFVIAPAVERKMGKAALAELTLGADQWKDAQWAQNKGLYANTFSTLSELDTALETFTTKLASYNPEALSAMKKVLWEGTENWDTLLADRAKISGGLVLSDFTKEALQQFK